MTPEYFGDKKCVHFEIINYVINHRRCEIWTKKCSSLAANEVGARTHLFVCSRIISKKKWNGTYSEASISKMWPCLRAIQSVVWNKFHSNWIFGMHNPTKSNSCRVRTLHYMAIIIVIHIVNTIEITLLLSVIIGLYLLVCLFVCLFAYLLE